MKRLILCVLLAFALRLGYAVASGALRHPETWEQEEIATNLVQGRGFLYEGFRSYAEPMYPFLAAAVYLVTNHSQTALIVIQLVLASLTVWIGGRAAFVATNDRAIRDLTALILAIHPGLIRYSSVLHPFVLDTLFFILAGLALVRYRQDPTLRRGCFAAAIIGLGALTRPTILVFLLVAWWIAPRLQRVVVLTLTTIVLIAPWTIRNAVVHHEFMLTRSGSGLVFWLGNNPLSSGSAIDAAGHPIVNDAPQELRQRIRSASEAERDRIYYNEAWSYIRGNPAAAVGRIVQRLYYFWWFSPQWGAAMGTRVKLIYRAWWIVLLILITVGVVRARQRDLLLLASLAILISLVQSLYYVEGRHRLAVEPLIVPLAAAGALAASGGRPRLRRASAARKR